MLIDLLFPKRCPVCLDVLPPGKKLICAPCVKKMPRVQEPYCLKCGRPMEAADEWKEYCRNCEKRFPSFEKGLVYGVYHTEIMSRLMAQVKYHEDPQLLDYPCLDFAESTRKLVQSFGAECLIPVPVHKSRLKERGYNQAELLAKVMSKVTGIPVRADLLMRVEDTKAQKALSREDRSLNLRAAFQAGEGPMPRRLVLVDDIYTTGATADACTEALLRAGAERVYVATVCCGAG